MTIEQRVTMVARRAYHELNLDISDLEREVATGTLHIPLHSFSSYMNSVLFPRQYRQELHNIDRQKVRPVFRRYLIF